MEPFRLGPNGSAAVSRDGAVLRCQQRAVVPAVPAIRGHGAWCAVQHCQLRTTDALDCLLLRPQARGLCAHHWRLPRVLESRRAAEAAAAARTAVVPDGFNFGPQGHRQYSV